MQFTKVAQTLNLPKSVKILNESIIRHILLVQENISEFQNQYASHIIPSQSVAFSSCGHIGDGSVPLYTMVYFSINIFVTVSHKITNYKIPVIPEAMKIHFITAFK